MTIATPTAELAEMNIAVAQNAALDVAMALDEKVIILGEDIADPIGGVFKVTKGLSTKYGTERVRATPIAEQSIVGAAVGLALGGYKPVAELMFLDFITLAMDQLVNHASKFRFMSGGGASSPITVRAAVGSNRFGGQHSQTLESWFMHVPGLKVVMASNPADAKGLLLSCIFSDDPCLFIENVSTYFTSKGEVPTGDVRVPLGAADVKHVGGDVTVVTYGSQVSVALEAAVRLEAEGIGLEVVDLRSLVPLDLGTVLRSVAKTRRAIVAHSATQFCGPGAEIASLITEELFSDLAAPVKRLGSAFAPRAFANSLSSEPTTDSILAAAKALAST